MTVGLVLVSHSRAVADGTAELARQMAPSVAIKPAGGSDDGGIGTSFDAISAALAEADDGDGVVILYDLGSALLTTETALEFAEPDQIERWRVVHAPLVEGAIAAAVAAEGGADLDAVVSTALAAGHAFAAQESGGAAGAGDSTDASDGDRAVTATVTLTNPLGLHARPAAQLARSIPAGTSVTLTVADRPPVDLRSMLSVVALGTRGGQSVQLTGTGPKASETIDDLVQQIRDGFGEAEPIGTTDAPSDAAGQDDPTTDARRPVAGASGEAIGPLHRLGDLPETVAAQDSAESSVERARLSAAIDAAARRLSGEGEFGRAHAELIRDPALARQADERLDHGAAAAWWGAIVDAARLFEDSGDPVIAARAVDVREAGAAVLGELGVQVDRVGGGVAGAVVLASDLGPAEVPKLLDRGAIGVVLTGGSPTAHAVIVARGLGLPMVLRAGHTLDQVADGTLVLINGDTGEILADPSEDVAAQAKTRIDAAMETAESLRAAAAAPVQVRGRQILVAANVGSVADARAAIANGADGIGLLRTELLVLDRVEYPDEDTQTRDLAAILDEMGERPVVIRVLDAGGDKPVTTLDLDPARNGFLGVRGLRYLLENPDLLHTQLRAICRASVGHRVSVMAPMVTTPQEASAFRAAVDRAVDQLAAEQVAHQAPDQVGIMIEVPAAALAADEFAGIVDFFSVGSNDLTSYTMAAERTEPGVADLLDPGATAIGRLLDQLCAHAMAVGIDVAVCGEMAGSPKFAMALVDRGVVELSMAPSRIPAIKALLREQPSEIDQA